MKMLLTGVGLLLLAPGALGPQAQRTDQDRAVAAILKAGGTVEREAGRKGKPVVGVTLTACEISAAGLALLPALTELRSLDL
jgi:hypothetical protein